jgi:hypothetical protein
VSEFFDAQDLRWSGFDESPIGSNTLRTLLSFLQRAAGMQGIGNHVTMMMGVFER